MNGRAYDYNLGRFLSVDPFVHAGSQGINPYSYILNNPLAGTDPTGYEHEKVSTVVKVAVAGSRIKRKVTVTAQSNGSDGATVSFSGSDRAAVGAVKSDVTNALSGAGFNVTDFGSQGTIAKIGSGKASENTGVNSSTSGISASDAGGLANAAYPENKSPEGWEAVTGKALKKQFGLTSEDMHTDEGLNASIFYNEKSDVYALAFAGTDPSTYGNLKANFLQNFGFSSTQYKQALRVAGVFATNLGGSTGVFTGHSLGGGLASAAAITYGMRGYTFNAAGLHRNTVGGRIDYNAAKGLINAYYSSSDPLSYFQDNRWVSAALSAYTKLPISFNPAVGRRIVVGGAEGHSMDSMYKALR